YQLPVIRTRVVPVPPPCLHSGDRCLSAPRLKPPAERRFRPTTVFNEQNLIRNTRGFPKSPLCSNALVTMMYLGRSKHVSLNEYKVEIKVYQQYCGTESICVYKGKLLEGDTFQFISKRHFGFPFSLTFYFNETEVERLSSCCEYRHLRRSRLRRRNSYFRVLHVTGAPPCYKCIVAMGLDKKPSLPKRKPRSREEKHVCCWGHAVNSQPCKCSLEQKSREDSESVTIPGHEASVETIEKTLETGEQSSKEK
ncbi:ERIC3 protein, partial [Spelaeornis formosus]|nr:ERIC3 protein [Elachura formosa]